MSAANAKSLSRRCRLADTTPPSWRSTYCAALRKAPSSAWERRIPVLTIALGLSTLLGSLGPRAALFDNSPELARATASSLDAARPLPIASDMEPVLIIENSHDSLVFSALGRDWLIELEPQALLSPAVRAEFSDTDLPRFYRGQVVGEPGSWARLARKDGVLSGHIASDGALHRLVPPATATRILGQSSGAEGYRLALVGRGGLQNGVTSSLAEQPILRSSTIGQRESTPLVSRAMRVGIVVDSLYDAAHDGDGLARALGVMNGVDGLYREQLGLAVIVESVRVHDSPVDDPLSALANPSVDTVLSTFRRIRQTDPLLSDDLALVHLFTGHKDPEAAIGLGWIGTVCRDDGYDVSLSTPFVFDTLLSAHEIGHNLGALHDEDPRCEVAETSAPLLGIMEARLSGTTPTEFTACSRLRLENTLGADCFIDSLDLSIRVGMGTPPTDVGDLLVVQVENLDPLRKARGVTSRVLLPEGSTVISISAECRVDDAQLICRHGDIGPGAEMSIFVRTDTLLAGEIVATLVPGNYLDSVPANDTMRIAVSGDLTPSDVTPSDVTPGDDATGSSTSNGQPISVQRAEAATDRPASAPVANLQTGGAGGTGILWAGLLALAGAARRATGQMSRSTENAAIRASASR